MICGYYLTGIRGWQEVEGGDAINFWVKGNELCIREQTFDEARVTVIERVI
jgi:hypothetical protein